MAFLSPLDILVLLFCCLNWGGGEGGGGGVGDFTTAAVVFAIFGVLKHKNNYEKYSNFKKKYHQ
jgi:hypothetical protein